MKVCISGIEGRMGSFVHKILEQRKSYDVVCGISNNNVQYKEIPIYNCIAKVISEKDIDLLIDFTEGESAPLIIKYALENNVKVISGTTGILASDLEELMRISREREVTFVHIPNFARGASEVYNILANLSDEYRQRDIVEIHSKKKKDKPSGTAIEFAKAMDIDVKSIESVRLNEVIASHEIILSNPGERIIIKHEILHRDAFLRGFLDTLDKVRVKPYFLMIGLKDFYRKN